jgi:C4-dicarboxylate-specific signal transduction histidine kinase/ABC-type uncharacterized transport system substrate-binding protein
MFRRLIKMSLAVAHSKLLLLVLIVALPVLSTPVASAAETPKKVLIFSGTDPNLPTVVLMNQILRSTLEKGWSGRIQFYSEALDNHRIPDEKYEREMVKLLQRKYEGENFELIFTLGSAGLKFLLKHKDELFSETPQIFINTNERETDGLDLGQNVTGVQGRIELKPALDLALSLHPGTRRVVVVTGSSGQDKLWETLAHKEFRSYEDNLEFTYLTNLTIEELRRELSAQPKNTIVFFLLFLTDREGNGYSLPEAVSLVAPSASAPVYVAIQSGFVQGVVGGHMISYEALGKAGAELGLRVLAGERPQDILPQTVPSAAMFDWRELRRWGIDESRLPAGSIVRYKEFSFWELYKWHIIGVLALCALEALLIAVLLVERRKRQRANVALDERVRFETLLSKLSAEFTDLAPSKVETVVKQWVDRLRDYLRGVTISFFEVPESGEETSTNQSDNRSSLAQVLAVSAVQDDDWCMAQLRRGTTINLARVPAALSSDKTGEKPCLDLKSLLAIPVAVNGSTFALAVETTMSYRTWPEVLVSHLRMVCEIFAGALERKRAGEELQKTRNDLAHVARLTAMGEMAASIAHEVNQPLAAIATYGDACVRLLSGESPNVKKSLEAINHIISDSMRASEVIKRIRALVKKTAHENTPQDINQIILDMVALTEADVLSRSVRLELHLAHDLPLVLGDRVELQQVMLNLILNGIEAMSATMIRARELTITSTKNGAGTVVVAVKDSGVGLNPEQTRRIFDPFVTTKPNGLGMGLSISRTILEAHGGRLWAEPNNGSGAKFQFTLPEAGEAGAEQ